MLLTGAYYRSLDDKQRLVIPKKVRDAISREEQLTLMVAPGTDGSLALYPEATFTKLAEQIEQASPHARDVRAFSRMFYARAQPVDVDPQGRMRIPADLAELAGLDKRVVLLGVRDHLELWDHDRWESYLTAQDGDYDALAESVFSPAPGSEPAEAPAPQATPLYRRPPH